jgi:hypothetical protein
MAAAPPSMKTVPPSSAAAHIATPESDFRVIQSPRGLESRRAATVQDDAYYVLQPAFRFRHHDAAVLP